MPATWICKQCGEQKPRNAPPCDNCGGMNFEAFELGPGNPSDRGRETARDGTLTKAVADSEPDATTPAETTGGRSWSGLVFWVCAAVVLVWLVLANAIAPSIAAATESIGGTAVIVGMMAGSVWTVSFVLKTAFGR